jgi:iron-sulfur cluster repair protein YtfE (RIC family)
LDALRVVSAVSAGLPNAVRSVSRRLDDWCCCGAVSETAAASKKSRVAAIEGSSCSPHFNMRLVRRVDPRSSNLSSNLSWLLHGSTFSESIAHCCALAVNLGNVVV